MIAVPAEGSEALLKRCRGRRMLLFGAPGSGKSTLVAELAEATGLAVLSVDPGSPAFGVPGAVCAGVRDRGGWRLQAFEAVCSLDAVRFRLPLVMAAVRVLERLGDVPLWIDAPGVVRGAAGEELLQALLRALAVDTVLVFSRTAELLQAVRLRAPGVTLVHVLPASEARHPGNKARTRRRTALWDAYLGDGVERAVARDRLPLLGTPPPASAPHAWLGRQVALLRGGRTRCMGEVVHVDEHVMTLRLPRTCGDIETADALLVRDAQRTPQGLLRTAMPFVHEPMRECAKDHRDEHSPPLTGRVGGVEACLLNGVFGDPLLHARLVHCGRSLLFDLGMGRRLPARTAHQVCDIFISHAHIDHLGGFLWLLRCRIGKLPPCRIVGPPGIVRHVQALVDGILWDRAGERAPCFEIVEWDGRELHGYRLVAGRKAELMFHQACADGVVLDTRRFRIRVCMLDHHTPVLAYAYEPAAEIHVRKERLRQLGLAPGPWLNALKAALHADAGARPIALPDGGVATAAALAERLVVVRPGKKWVYATDCLDSPENRRRLIELARGAHTMFCEARFREADRLQAARTGHLTSRACGEIAREADVGRLVPFHFSQRYAGAADDLIEEIVQACPGVRVWRPEIPH